MQGLRASARSRTIAMDQIEDTDCPDDSTIAELLGHALAADAAGRVEAHLDRCADCRRHISDLIRRAPDPGEPARHSLGGRYAILGVLGRGGMGEVFLAYDPELGRRVAVKLLRTRVKDADVRLRREAQAMARLTHPNVVSVYDLGLEGGQVFVAMELVEGTTLVAWARGRGVDEVLDACVQAGRGLAAAHAVALVHRDLTARNVLVGTDGRVRVTDFGLVRMIGEPDFERSPGVAIAPCDLTRTGEFVGTPAYAAPEVFAGKVADEKSDQWSLAATTWHVVFDQLPFAGTTFADLADAVVHGRVVTPPTARRVPTRARRALLRALSVDPADRFPTIQALLDELRPRVRRRWIEAAIATAIGGVAVWSLAGHRHAAPNCQAEAMADVWGPPQREALRSSFAATGSEIADDQFGRVERAFDRYSAAWSLQSVEACEGAKSQAILDLRIRCLHQRLESLRALRDELERPLDGGVLRDAAVAALSLPRLDSCADTTALARRAPPTDAAVAARFDTLSARLARVDALDRLGRYDEARRQASEAVELTGATDLAAMRADALYALGDVQDSAGDPEAGKKTLEDASRIAAIGHDDAIVAKASLELVYIVGSEEQRSQEALAMLPLVTAAVERADDPILAAQLESTEADVLEGVGQMVEAKQHAERSVELLEARLGSDHLDVAKAQSNLATLLFRLDQPREGHALQERALVTFEQLLGRDHPLVARAAANEGHAFADEHRWSESERALDRALASEQRAFGPDHVEVAWTLRELGHLWFARREWTKARGYYERALPTFEKATGAASGQIAELLAQIGATLMEDHRCDEARPRLEQAIAIGERAFGSARSSLEDPMTRLAVCLAEAGKHAEAIALVDRARAIGEQDGDDPIEIADRRFREARVLATTRRDEARTLAIAARDAYAAAGTEYRRDRDAVAAWLAR